MNPHHPKGNDPAHPKEIPNRPNPTEKDPVQDPNQTTPRGPQNGDVENP